MSQWLCCVFALSHHIPRNASQFPMTTVFCITALCFIESTLKYESIGALVDQQRFAGNKLIVKEMKSLRQRKNLEPEAFSPVCPRFSSLFCFIWDTHLVSVRQRCVTRDFFDPSGSIKKKLQKTCALTPLTATAACSTEVEDTNMDPVEWSVCHILQEKNGNVSIERSCNTRKQNSSART